jgi:hypothetical protein
MSAGPLLFSWFCCSSFSGLLAAAQGTAQPDSIRYFTTSYGCPTSRWFPSADAQRRGLEFLYFLSLSEQVSRGKTSPVLVFGSVSGPDFSRAAHRPKGFGLKSVRENKGFVSGHAFSRSVSTSTIEGFRVCVRTPLCRPFGTRFA